MVVKYVEGNSANMGYSVITDNNEQYMGNQWMRAAGQGGIPATFIIKNEKIIWIGNPAALDTTLPKIFDGSYDMAAYKVKLDKRVASYKKMFAANVAELKPVNDALAAKEFQKAFELMDKLVAEKPSRRNTVNLMKFTALLKQRKEEETIAFSDQWQKEDKDAPTSIFITVQNEDSLSKSTCLWAARLYEGTAPKMNPVTYHMLASLYARGGDYKTAVSNEEKAVEAAKTALQKGEMVGTVMDCTVSEYKDTLARYKKASKAANRR